MTYAVDQPWLVKRFILTAPKDGEFSEPPVPGRTWHLYYPGIEWSGIVLPDGRIWWNDDPHSWHSTELQGHDFEDLSLGSCRLVYPFLCYHYPEKPSVDGSPGWESSPTAFPSIRLESDSPLGKKK